MVQILIVDKLKHPKLEDPHIYRTCVYQFGCVLQVGACIVNSERKIVGIGYNGMPNRCSDDELPWQREADDKLDTKYPYGEPL